MYHRSHILNTSTGTGYDIHVACTFSTDETINFRDLKRQIHAVLELLHSQFNISIRAISSYDNYDPTSIPGSSNPVMAEERTHSRAQKQRPSRISVQNVDVDVDEDDEEEEWHLDVEEDDIQDATYINMDEIDDAVDVEEIVKEWQIFIPFINQEIKHMCA
jgi:uncharacterized protein YlxP (DUF503 family)